MTANPATLQQMTRIWTGVLGIKTVQPDDNFFALGGHSLLAVKLVAAIQQEMAIGDELKISALMDFPTLDALAEHVDMLKNSEETGEI